VPRQPCWYRRIPLAIHCLTAISDPLVDRRSVEVLLEIKQTDAQRVLKRAGAFLSGGALVMPRLQFLDWLEGLSRSEVVLEEQSRSERVEEKLAAMRHELRGRRVRIAHAPDIQYRTLDTLPKAIELRPGELRVKFYGFEDLAAMLLELASAMINDLDRIRAQVEDAG
jgi:hypothetical protein